MKKAVTVFAIAAAAVAFSAVSDPTQGGKYSTNAAERVRQKLREKSFEQRIYEHTGGRVANLKSGKGRIVVVNAQKLVDQKKVAEFVGGMSIFHGLRIEAVEGQGATLATADARKKELGANAVIFVVQDGDLPSSLVAYDSGWAIVNAGKLGDAPAVILGMRLHKAIYRAFALLCGGADTPFADTIMSPADSPEALDALKLPNKPVPMWIGVIQEHMKRLGMEPMKVTTYRKACEEGWAPPPANDVQKAVWDQVRQMPSKPLKIEFDPKQGK